MVSPGDTCPINANSCFGVGFSPSQGIVAEKNSKLITNLVILHLQIASLCIISGFSSAFNEGDRVECPDSILSENGTFSP